MPPTVREHTRRVCIQRIFRLSWKFYMMQFQGSNSRKCFCKYVILSSACILSEMQPVVAPRQCFYEFFTQQIFQSQKVLFLSILFYSFYCVEPPWWRNVGDRKRTCKQVFIFLNIKKCSTHLEPAKRFKLNYHHNSFDTLLGAGVPW